MSIIQNEMTNKSYTRGINLQAEKATEISSSDSATFEASCLFVGTGGTVKVIDASSNTATFTNIPDGYILPVLVTKVFSTNTTASGLILLK